MIGGRNNDYLDDFGIPREEGDDDEYAPVLQQHRHDDDVVDDGGFVRLGDDADNTATAATTGKRFANSREAVAANNLDVYFSSLYLYYYNRGLLPIVTKAAFEFVSLTFTVLLSAFLFYVDWRELALCKDESTCKSQFTSYLTAGGGGTDDNQRFASLRQSFLMSIYVLLFLAYAVFNLWSFVQNTLRQALAAKWVFEERLGISTTQLRGGAVDWDAHVVRKLQELHESGDYRISSSPIDVDACVIAQRILRKENFLVAMFNRGVVDLTIPSLAGTTTFFSPSLEVSLVSGE